jgi:hypothetical protein
LSTFGDSLPTGALFAEEFGLMSQATLHRGSRITKWSRRKNTHNKYTFDRWIGILCRGPDGGVEAGALGAGSLILIPLEDLPVVF